MAKKEQIDRHQGCVYPLRLPQELKQWLQEKAAEHRRSFNSEVVVMLEKVQKNEEAHAQT